MGAWGTGLYSGDFAMGLRGTIRAVARLPFPADRLIEVLCDTEAEAARNPNDSDHTVFWLVLADQFWKRGIECPRARDAALSIIDEGRDREAMAALGMPAPDLRRRGGCSPNCAAGWPALRRQSPEPPSRSRRPI